MMGSGDAHAVLGGGGEAGAVLRARDWPATPLGAPTAWPCALRGSVRLMLDAGHPVAVLWGEDALSLHNDAFGRLLGRERHADALGRPAREGWGDAWVALAGPVGQVRAGRGPTWHEAEPVALVRDGTREELLWTHGCSAIADEDAPGRVAGVVLICTEAHAAPGLRPAADPGADLRTLTDALPVLISYVDAERRYRFLNKAYETWFSRRREEILGRPVRDVIGEAAYAAVGPRIDAALRGERLSFEQFMPYSGAKGRHVEVEYIPDPDERGRIRGFHALIQDVTERREAHAARLAAQAAAEAEAAERSAILSQLAEGVIVTDRAGRITFVNEAARRIHGVLRLDVDPSGYTEAYHLLTEAGEFYPTEDLPLSRAVLRGEEVNEARWRVRRPDGSEVLAVGSARPVLGADGSQLGSVLTLRDATEAEAAQRSLRESEARLRALTDNLPSGMVFQITTGRDGGERRFLYVSQSHLKLTGIPAEAVTADPGLPYRLILEEDRPRLAEAERAAIEAGTTFDVQARFRRADGEVRWARIISAPRPQPDGRVTWDGIQIDVTDQKAAEAVLRDQNATLEARVAEALAERKIMADIVEGTNSLVQVIDADFRWLAINRAAGDECARVFGLRPRLGESMLDHLAHVPEAQAAARAIWGRALAGEAFTETVELGPPGGERRFYEMRHDALIGVDGARIGAYQLATDVTDRMREQMRLTEAEEALRQSQKMEAMGQLTGGVAHDFNNLLTPIVAVLDRLGRPGTLVEREQRLVAAAAQSAERARLLVQRLLAFARRQPLQTRAVDLRDLIHGMSDLVSSTLGPQIRVAVDAPEGLPPAKADPNQVEMALLNLCVNARDAMPDGGTLRISASAETVRARGTGPLRPGAYVRLSVADTGLGMDEATLARAVEPFFSTKGVGKGTGLGLSMAHGLALQLGGSLLIHSRLGLGTNVELWLPRSAEDADGAGRGEAPGPPRPLRGTALLVDDDDLVRLSAADMLADLGYQVVEAASAEAALMIIAAGTDPDIVVTDHLMPGLSGSDLARRLRAERPELPVLVMSGYAEGDDTEPELPRLPKPFRKDDLEASLARLASAAALKG